MFLHVSVPRFLCSSLNSSSSWEFLVKLQYSLENENKQKQKRSMSCFSSVIPSTILGEYLFWIKKRNVIKLKQRLYKGSAAQTGLSPTSLLWSPRTGASCDGCSPARRVGWFWKPAVRAAFARTRFSSFSGEHLGLAHPLPTLVHTAPKPPVTPHAPRLSPLHSLSTVPHSCSPWESQLKLGDRGTGTLY